MSREQLLLAIPKTVRHFFPSLRSWLDALPDPRDADLITYPVRFLVWTGLLMYLFLLRARRRLRHDLNSEYGVANLNRLAGTDLETLPHPDTPAYLFKALRVEALSEVLVKMVRKLLRKRALERLRLLSKWYLVAIDGTGFLSFSKPHCGHCLKHKLANGQTLYYHPVLEAKLVCWNGLAISIGTEFIENTDGDDTQDCELKAFHRLVPRLRESFPQLPICLLLDALYLNEPVMALLEQHRLDWITTFKEGSLPQAYGEFETLRALVPQQTLQHVDGRLHRQYRWVHSLRQGQHTFNAFECIEAQPDAEPSRFVWATNLDIKRSNVDKLSQQGGRLRWKIENEGFNTQKNGGYELEHAYCEQWNAACNFYLLMQIAHLISQLIAKGSLLAAPAAELFGSLRAFAARMLEAWRTILLDQATLERQLASRFQIRLHDL
jgi:hypothetical protein